MKMKSVKTVLLAVALACGFFMQSSFANSDAVAVKGVAPTQKQLDEVGPVLTKAYQDYIVSNSKVQLSATKSKDFKLTITSNGEIKPNTSSVATTLFLCDKEGKAVIVFKSCQANHLNLIDSATKLDKIAGFNLLYYWQVFDDKPSSK
jgi:hypothetical protein